MLNGIDVSSYQPGIGNVGADFVLVKATEGTSYINPYMNQQLQTAKLRGQYHFASGGNVIAEANHFLSTYYKGNLPILDFEYPATDYWTVANVKQWLDYVYSKTGIKPMLYMGLQTENERNWSSCTSYPLWIAQYNNYNPQYGFKPRPLYGELHNWSKLTMFQYSSTTYLSGWNGGLDVDVCYVPWEELVGKENGDDEMSWHPEVKYNELGQFKINREGGATLYSDSKLTKPIRNGMTGTYKVFDVKDGAVNCGGNQWFSQADGLTKINPLAINDNARAIAKVTTVDAYTQADTKPGKGITHLDKGTTWKVFGRSGKYLVVGGEKQGKYLNADKAVIVL